MELPFTTCPSSLFSREHDIYNHIAHRKMIIINNENLISIHFDFLKISYFLITKKIEFMTYYGTLFTYIFRNLNPWTQTRMFPYGSAFIMFPYSISNHSPLKKNKYYYILTYVSNYACIFSSKRLSKERSVGS